MVKERSIVKDIDAFCGWDFMMKLITVSPRIEYRGVISGLFITGCRVSELIQLQFNNIRLDIPSDPLMILFENVPVIKRYSRKTRQRYKAYRTFPVRMDEPAVQYFIKYINYAKQMYPRPYPWTRTRIFQIVRDVGKALNCQVPFSRIHSSQLYPHWFRAQRARQLRYDYNFTDEELRDWFGWKYSQYGMPAIYGKLSWLELARKMGISVKI